MVAPAARRELAQQAVSTKGVSVRLACETFVVSQTCYRYQPKTPDEDRMIADALLALAHEHPRWGDYRM